MYQPAAASTMVRPLTQCCCGCTLKTGTIVIATLYLIGGIGNCVQSLRSFGNLGQLYKISPEFEELFPHKWVYSILAISLVLQVTNVILSSYLIYGASKSKCVPMKLWVWFQTFILVISDIFFVFVIIYFAHLNTPKTPMVGPIIAVTVSLFIFNLLTCYFLWVVNSHRLEVENVKQNNMSRMVLT